MQRIDHATKDTDAFGSGKHGYKTTAPYSVLAPNAQNSIQEELCRAVEAFTALNSGDLGQLADILTQLLTAAGGSSTLQESASSPVFSTNKNAHDHPSSASNKWKNVLELPLPGAKWARVFSGDDTASPGGLWAITINAKWLPASGDQEWDKDVAGDVAYGLICDSGGLHWYKKNAGAGTWTSWPDDGDVTISGDLTVSGSYGAVNASTLDATGDVFAGDDVIATDRFLYASPGSVPRTIAPAAGYGDGALDPSNGSVLLASGESHSMPLRVPNLGSLGAVRVKLIGVLGTADYQVQLLRKHGINWGSSPGYTYTQVDVATGTAASGTAGTESGCDWGGLAISSSETYEIVVKCTAGPGGLGVLVADCMFTDPGPRND